MIVSHQGKTRGNSRLGSQLTTQTWWQARSVSGDILGPASGLMIAEALRQIAWQ
jgi:hypothetical protein